MHGSAITQIAPGLSCLDSEFKVWGCTGSVRMSVIGVGNDLVIYSPVALYDAHIAQIAALGRVGTIIAPNLYHHMFLRDAAAAFPNARVLVPRGLETKIGPVSRAETMTADVALGLPADIEHHVFAGHAIRETCLFHRPTGTLITADLLYNYHAEQFPAERAFFSLIGIYGRPAVPFYHRFAIQDKSGVQHCSTRCEVGRYAASCRATAASWKVTMPVLCLPLLGGGFHRTSGGVDDEQHDQRRPPATNPPVRSHQTYSKLTSGNQFQPVKSSHAAETQTLNRDPGQTWGREARRALACRGRQQPNLKASLDHGARLKTARQHWLQAYVSVWSLSPSRPLSLNS